MLFFVDESWQDIAGTQVAALGAVALPVANYNEFCSAVFRIKRDLLGATELNESELKGTSCFSRSAFRYAEANGSSKLIDAATQVLSLVSQCGGATFTIWTTNPMMTGLRQHQTTVLPETYKQLLFALRAFAQERGDRPGLVIFDQRKHREDEMAACTVQNYMVRTATDWQEHFLQVPLFAASSTSPGLQAADLVAYLGPHQADREFRPELSSSIQLVWNLRHSYSRDDGKLVGSFREVQ
jgi:hypothetical protein